ncbi:inositol phospholipid synthesis and fat-storage-inducing TM-domain-containing protein [Podospora appendiculata]|uniref:Inositol phospholipid synthesis and fat-storage-inducing TM-domain-containing protein n=1 Tax=Podospora appendiculata TaxID=314037 RepID=A0AAE0X0M7_9PEZI|nr:inositol phospholipid synthesis and fat-storage-inducing TM-domain-containing protein [Podospora appendiculata]
MDTPPSHNTRSSRRKTPSQIASQLSSPIPSPSPAPAIPRRAPNHTAAGAAAPRNTPYLPTPTELALVAGYPLLLLFGALFSLVSPETRAAPYDVFKQAHSQDPALAPSYFARKDNLLNVLFVKRGWAWVTVAFFAFALTHPAVVSATQRGRAAVRWGLVTLWWVFVTQWFFGPAIIDRGFRWSGGKCEVVENKVEEGEGLGKGDFVTAAACKAYGGRWSGGHDISGHVFLLVLGSGFLVQEVVWVAARWGRGGRGEERLAAVVVVLSGWMLLMTAIYFHTWFEKDFSSLSRDCTLFILFPGSIAAQNAPTNLPELVRSAFNSAKTSGALNYYPTQVALLDVNSVPFQLRFSPALANKPKASPGSDATTKPIDPFDNPAPDLLIAPLPPHHILVLNKFAIVPEHFILATRVFKPQTHLLEADDLAATYACIEAYHRYHETQVETSGAGTGELFAFFNSGAHSGASQPHRHVQLLPVDRMRDGLDGHERSGASRWDVLADRLVDGEEGNGDAALRVPFRTFAARIAPGMDGRALLGVYLGLYKAAEKEMGAGVRLLDGMGAWRGGRGSEREREREWEEGEARISYNLAITRDVMVLLPRVAEGAEIVTEESGQPVGVLALNGTVLAGTALVKSREEWEVLRAHPERAVELLGKIGLPVVQRPLGSPLLSPRSEGFKQFARSWNTGGWEEG